MSSEQLWTQQQEQSDALWADVFNKAQQHWEQWDQALNKAEEKERRGKLQEHEQRDKILSGISTKDTIIKKKARKFLFLETNLG